MLKALSGRGVVVIAIRMVDKGEFLVCFDRCWLIGFWRDAKGGEGVEEFWLEDHGGMCRVLCDRRDLMRIQYARSCRSATELGALYISNSAAR